MMKFDAFRSDGFLRDLKDFLKPIDGEGLTWSVLFFDGIGKAPDNLTMDRFCELARTRPSGFIVSWAELLDFARDIEQTYDCLIVGADRESEIVRKDLESECYRSVRFVFEAVDSSYWNVKAFDGYIVE